MRKIELRQPPRGVLYGLAASAVTALALVGGWQVARLVTSAHAPAPLSAAAVTALQTAAFTQAEARPGLTLPQSVPVRVERGETLERAVARAGVGPAEAHLAVEMLG